MLIAGGLLIALSFIFGIEAFKEKGTITATLMDIGDGEAFALIIPVLAGLIAFPIADRPGLALGLIGGVSKFTPRGFPRGYRSEFHCWLYGKMDYR